jgi:hypothetical protein
LLFHTGILIRLSTLFFVSSCTVDPGIEVFESVLHVTNEIKILFLAVVIFYRDVCFDYLWVPELDDLQ